MASTERPIRINRAPVLTLWAATVAERLGFDRATALTLGQAVAGMSAHAKAISLGIAEPSSAAAREHGQRVAEGERLEVELLGRAVPVVRTGDGLRALDKGRPGNPVRIERYLAAAGAWRGTWPEVERAARTLPLRRAHALVTARAEGVLPFAPEEPHP